MSGFRGNPSYQWMSIDGSANGIALGLDFTDGNKLKLQVTSSGSALPSGTAQMTIDPSANGNISFAPNGSGAFNVSNGNLNVLSGSISATVNSAAASPGTIVVLNRTISNGAVGINSELGRIVFSGFDGSNQINSAIIASDVTNTVGANSVPANLIFAVSNGASGPVTRMIIASDGSVTMQPLNGSSNPALTIVRNGLTSTGTTTLSSLGAGAMTTNSSGVVSSTAGTAGQVLTSNGAGNAPTFQDASGGNWSVITANQTIAVNNNYICNKGSTLVLTLPTTAAVGDITRITGINTALGWQIAQNANQQIFIGTSSTTVGGGGSLTSSATRDSIEIVCVVANLTWNALSAFGNITVV